MRQADFRVLLSETPPKYALDSCAKEHVYHDLSLSFNSFSPHRPFSTAVFPKSFHLDVFPSLFGSQLEISCLFLSGNFSFLSISIVI